MELTENIRKSLREVPDFPKPGILFYDITPVLADGALFADLIDIWAARLKKLDVNKVVGLESRGFIFAAPLAARVNAGFVPVRKPGKLPAEVDAVKFETEYSHDGFELHRDAIKQSDRVAIVDDLLATGGTALAASKLVENRGGQIIELSFLLELDELKGRDKLGDRNINSWLRMS